MFCPTCGTLTDGKRKCPYCTRRPADDEGTKTPRPEPPATPPRPQWRTCPGCGGKVSLKSKYEYCFECRASRDPAIANQKEFDDENQPDNLGN